MAHHIYWERLSHYLFELCQRFDDIYLQRKCRMDTLKILFGVLQLKSGMDESFKTVFKHMQKPPAASTFCEARRKIPASVIAEISKELLELWDSFFTENLTWNGYEIFAVDGSTLNLPRSLNAEGFHISSTNYTPQGLLSVLYRVLDRKIIGLDFSSNHCERAAAIRLTENVSKKDILICDKGYYSFGILCEFANKGLKSAFSLQSGSLPHEIEDFKNSNLQETITSIIPSRNVLDRARKAHPDIDLHPQKVRLIKYKYDGIEEILLTTIFDENIKAEEIVKLVKTRWTIEELYKAFKTTLKIEDFHSKNANGIEQELHGACIIWNLSRMMESFIPEADLKKTC